MCLPVVAVTAAQAMAMQIGLAAAGAAAQIYNQKQVQKAEQRNFKYIQQQANLDANAAYTQIARQQEQETISAKQTIQDNMDKAMAAQSAAAVSAAESGATGTSVAALMNEYEMERTTFASRVAQQRAWSSVQAREQALGVRSQQQARIYQALPRSPGPDYLGAALSIGGASMQAFYNNTVYDPSQGKRVMA